MKDFRPQSKLKGKEITDTDMERYGKKQLTKDLKYILDTTRGKYILMPDDIFALGYLAGRYGLTKLRHNEEEVIRACLQYDQLDDLALLDTIAEVLMDLKIINRNKFENYGNTKLKKN